MRIWQDDRISLQLIALAACLSVANPLKADEPKPPKTWHLELRSIGGGADYTMPYSPACFSPDSKQLAISLLNRKNAWERLAVDKNSVLCKDVPDGSGIGIWDVESLRFVKWIKTDSRKVIRYTRNGKAIAALDDSKLLRWDVGTGKQTETTLVEGATAFNKLNSGFAWGPDDSIVALTSNAVVHYSAQGKQLGSYPIKSTLNIGSLESSSDGRFVAADHYFWDLANDKRIAESSGGLCFSVFRPGTTDIWARSSRSYGAIANWTPESNRRKFPFKEGLDTTRGAKNGSPQDKVEGLAFSPNGKVLASVGFDNCVHLWNVATGQRIVTLEAAKGPRMGKRDAGDRRPSLQSVKFSPGGQWLLAHSVDSVSMFKIEHFKPYLKAGRVHQITQYFAGTELVEEIVTKPRGAKTLVGSMLHTKEQVPGSRVAALFPGDDEVWYDAVVLGRIPIALAKEGIHYKVHYEGYSRTENKTVPEWRIRPKLAPHLKVRDLE